MKVLLVTMYFPPAGGGGVQRSLKLAQYLPALGIETHVLAPDDPKWVHTDSELRVPTQAWVHRARYLGPRARKPAEELAAADGFDRALVQAQVTARRLLLPDASVTWNLTAIPAAIRIARREGIDAVITTSPPPSVHFVGAAVQKASGARWIADLRDPLVANQHRRDDTAAARARQTAVEQVARLVARHADAVTCVSEAIADEMRGLDARGTVRVVANGCDFDDFAGLEYRPAERFRITHTGSFFGKRDPKPFLQAFRDADLDAVARFVGDFRSSDREWAATLGLGDRLELVDYLPRADALRVQRDSEALLLLIPEAGGRGKGVLSGKVFEYIAAGRPILAVVPPDGAAAQLIRETSSGVVVAPDDVSGIRDALVEMHARFSNGGLPSVELAKRDEDRLSRARARRGDGRAPPGDHVTSHAVPLSRIARERVLVQPVLDGLFLLTILTVTFHKLQWELAGSLTLSDVLTSVFLVLFAWDRFVRDDGRFTRTAMIALAFFLVFALVYLAGFYNLDTAQALAQWAKGMVKFVLHFGFLVAGVALLARRGMRFYWYALAAFLGGIGLNAVYGVIQLVLAEGGVNLDELLIEPITSRQTGINVFGAVGGTQEVFRPNALTGDPNHLGIELVIPLLVLTPLYLRLEAGHRLKTPLAISLAFLLVVELATLSRSALLGLGCGALVLALPYRRHLRRPAFLVPLAAVGLVVAAVILVRLDFFLTVLRARTNTSRGAASPHFEVYSFIPDVLSTNPFLGLGLNNFAVYYEFVTGRPDFGPHSFYVATIVETGIVGAALFAVFVVWLFRRLGAARRIGRALSVAGDPLAARVRPVAWGMTAALVATLVANVFYLTMTFYYFYVFATLAAALPVVARARRE